MSDNMLNGKIPRLPPSLIEVVNDLVDEITSMVDRAAYSVPTKDTGGLAMILSRFCQEIIAASAQAAHSSSDEDDLSLGSKEI